MDIDRPFQIDTLTENDKHELLKELEILAEYEGLRRFAKEEIVGTISGEVRVLIDSKASDNDVLKHDGSVGLTDDWDAGSFKITAEQLRSSIAIGTAPLEIVSTTVVPNLNADKVDGKHSSDFIGMIHYDDFALVVHGHNHGALSGLEDDDHTQYLLASAIRALSADWDIGNGRMIQADKIRARDGDGLALYEDSEVGIFIKDGGNIGIGTSDPTEKLHIKKANANSDHITTQWGTSYPGQRLSMGGDSNIGPYIVSHTDSDGKSTGNYGAGKWGISGNGHQFWTSPVTASGDTRTFTERMRIKSTGVINIASLSIYANNAAAITGGLVAGDLYRTGGDPDTVCIVH